MAEDWLKKTFMSGGEPYENLPLPATFPVPDMPLICGVPMVIDHRLPDGTFAVVPAKRTDFFTGRRWGKREAARRAPKP